MRDIHKVFYSKRKLITDLFIYFVILLINIFIIVSNNSNIEVVVGVVSFVIFSTLIFFKLKEIRKKGNKVKFIISQKGIDTMTDGFIRWDEINEVAIIAKSGVMAKGLVFFLKIVPKDSSELEIALNDCNINRFRLKKILTEFSS